MFLRAEAVPHRKSNISFFIALKSLNECKVLKLLKPCEMDGPLPGSVVQEEAHVLCITLQPLPCLGGSLPPARLGFLAPSRLRVSMCPECPGCIALRSFLISYPLYL